MSFLYYLFYFFCFFSYVKIIPNSMDTQPYFIILGCAIIVFEVFNKRNIAKVHISIIWLVFLVILLSVYNMTISDDYIEILRAFTGYFSILIVSVVSFWSFKRRILTEKAFLLVFIIWFSIACLQRIFGNDIFSFLVSVRTSTDRGVTSLAPEPTFYAFYVTLIYILYIIYGLVFSRKLKYKKSMFILFLLQLILLSKSSMLIIANVILFFIYIFIKFLFSMGKINKTTVFVVLSLVIFPFLIKMFFDSGVMDGTRFSYIINNLDIGLYHVLVTDASINDRVAHIYLSFYGFYSNDFMPGLFSTFNIYSGNRFFLSNGLFWWGASTNKILSFWGGIIYELGFFAIFYFIYLFFSIKNFFIAIKLKYISISIIISMFLLLFLAIPISNPIVTIIFSLMYYSKVRSHNE